MSLSNPQGGAILGTSELTVSINDDDEASSVAGTGTLNLENSTYTVNEDAGELSVNVKRTDGSTGEISVLVTLGGNATALGNDPATYLDDYQLDSASQVNFGRLTLPDGVDAKVFKIIISDDTDVEGTEAFNITLSSPAGGATLGNQVLATVTIVDNDSTPPAESPQGNGEDVTEDPTSDAEEESGGAVGLLGLLLMALVLLGFRQRVFRSIQK